MTNRDAIEYFQNHQEVGNKEQNDAVYLAIKALRALETVRLIKFNVFALNELVKEAENE